MAVETEIKLRCADPPEQMRKKIESLGYRQILPRTLESDQLYDFPTGDLRASDRLLRLRSSGADWIVTYKGPGDRAVHKSRTEIETAVTDGEAFRQILNALGFQPTFLYEKYRTTFQADGEEGIVTLDETPMGCFLELEGPGHWIDLTALKFGYGLVDYITQSYAALYHEHRTLHPNIPKDMTF